LQKALKVPLQVSERQVALREILGATEFFESAVGVVGQLLGHRDTHLYAASGTHLRAPWLPPLPHPSTGGSPAPGNSAGGVFCAHVSSYAALGVPPLRVARQEAGGRASSTPLLCRQGGLPIWRQHSPIRPCTKGILFSARLY